MDFAPLCFVWHKNSIGHAADTRDTPVMKAIFANSSKKFATKKPD